MDGDRQVEGLTGEWMDGREAQRGKDRETGVEEEVDKSADDETAG